MSKRKTSAFFGQIYWLEKNQQIKQELEERRESDTYEKECEDFERRLARGPSGVEYYDGSFEEDDDYDPSVVSTYKNCPTYDILRQGAKSEFELDRWDECERLEREYRDEEQILNFMSPLVKDTLLSGVGKERVDLPFYEFGLEEEDEDVLNMLLPRKLEEEKIEEKQKEPEKVEEVKPEKALFVESAYDTLMIYLYLYSLGEVKREILSMDTIADIVVSHMKEKNIRYEVKDTKILEPEIQRVISKFLDSYFSGGDYNTKNIGLIPHVMFFVTSSIEKFRDAFEFFDRRRYAILRGTTLIEEIQGSFLDVGISKVLVLEPKFPAFFIEDTSLSLEKCGYKCGPYIKDFFSMGSDKFFEAFKGSKSLWISTLVGFDKMKNYFISVYGTCGKIGVPSRKGYSFDTVNYVTEGISVSDDKENWINYHPRLKVFDMFRLMLERKDGGIKCRKCKFRDKNSGMEREALFRCGFFGDDPYARDEFNKVIDQTVVFV